MRVVAEIAKDYKERIKLACESLETLLKMKESKVILFRI